MTNSRAGTAGQQMDKLIVALDSLLDGDQAVEMLIASGPRAVPDLSSFLLKGSTPLTWAEAARRAPAALPPATAYARLRWTARATCI
jgi:hypothetical protein